MSSPADAPGKSARVSLAALRPLLPYALKHRGRILGALIALIVASGATLAVPLRGARHDRLWLLRAAIPGSFPPISRR